MRRLILRSFQSPGDILMLTAAVRDLHLANPGVFQTDVRTAADDLWKNNPYITPLREGEPGVESFDMHYPLIHQSNHRPYHFIHGYPQHLEQVLGVRVPLTQFSGDVYLTPEEKLAPPPGADQLPERFWIIMAGGKYDFTAKWWNPASYQAVVDHFKGKITFVQCGESHHWHPPLTGVVNLIGKTNLREFVRLMYHADGVLCPVTFAMHLAAAVESKPGRPKHRACVVVAGGREPTQWEAYPHHQYLSTNGALTCCAEGGCWKSRCQLVGDGDAKDTHDVCQQPVQIRDDLRIPKCLDLITPQHVIEHIEFYYRGGALQYRSNGHAIESLVESPPVAIVPEKPQPAHNILIRFRHGLGDAVQFTAVLRHLAKLRPDWNIDVAALIGKHSAFRGLCRNVYLMDRNEPSRAGYQNVYDLEWHECHSVFADVPSTKVERCLRDVFGITPQLDLCGYEIQISPEVRERARAYLESICRPPGADGRYKAVVIHYEGNTSRSMKDLPVPTVQRLCQDVLDLGYVPIILDWDARTPLADNVRIHNPNIHHPLWGATGTGDAEAIAALIEQSSLMIGVDSGPLHVAAATSTPTLGVWIAHHPVHYCSTAENVLHLVPENHGDFLRDDRPRGLQFFAEHYRSRSYTHLENTLRGTVYDLLAPRHQDGLVQSRGFWIRRDNAPQDLVVVQDIFEEDAYQIEKLSLPRPFVVDVGAHIGSFSKRFHQRFPNARIVAVECCPENIPALQRNLERIATIVQAAVTYEDDIALLNAVYPECQSTGGSTVISKKDIEHKLAQRELATDPAADSPSEYWADLRPIRTVTLEDLLAQFRADRIDILKLDCEGSEFSILANTPSLDRIGVIVGEYHGRERFLQLLRDRLPDWKVTQLGESEIGTFSLGNPRWFGEV